jgi:hypothetical protein
MILGQLQKFRWPGRHFLKGKENFQNYIKYIFGYLIEPCIEIWCFELFIKFSKFSDYFPKKSLNLQQKIIIIMM